MPRLFTAIEIPHQVRLSLSLLRGGLPGAHWIDETNYHITLRFFGDINNDQANELTSSLHYIDRGCFKLKLDQLAVFGSKKPRVLYARIMPCAALTALQNDIDRRAKKLKITNSRLKFIPHVSIAKITQVRLQDLVAYLTSHGHFSTSWFDINRFVLMSAKASTGGGPYVIEKQWPLSLQTVNAHIS